MTTDIQKLYHEIAEDNGRNNLIFNDVLQALEQGRKPIMITERVAHAEQLAQRFDPFVKNLLILTGRVPKKERSQQLKQLAELPSADEFLDIATGKYIGESFDETRLDTLFLTMPVSWKGILQQYIGRLHRDHLNKTEVRVYDYVDGHVSVLERMFAKRQKSYHTRGYIESDKTAGENEQMRLF